MAVLVSKGLATLLLFLVTFLAAYVPIWLYKRGTLTATGSPRRKLVYELLNSFSGGVFLGTSLLHLLAEGREEYENYKESVGVESEYPVFEALTAVGLFLVAFVEKIGIIVISRKAVKPKHAVACGQQAGQETQKGAAGEKLGRKQKGERSEADKTRKRSSVGGNATEISKREQWMESSKPQENRPGTSSTQRDLSIDDLGQVQMTDSNAILGMTPENKNWNALKENVNQNQTTDGKQDKGRENGGRAITTENRNRNRNAKTVPTGGVLINYGTEQSSTTRLNHVKVPPYARSPTIVANGEAGTNCTVGVNLRESISDATACVTQMPVARALLLLVALSFHTVFDGLAVGLQSTDFNIWEILLPVCIHKALVAFSLGLKMAASCPLTSRRPQLFMLLFSFVSPIGVAIGMGVTSGQMHAHAQLLVSSILQALATGTFLYVTFFEILAPHFGSLYELDARAWVEVLKVGVMVVGFAGMALLRLAHGHNHEHHGDDDDDEDDHDHEDGHSHNR
ncbi:protein zntC-like [Littorina saxatilis]|uniref:Uncharacterized protein n=1 Tax=Littorina saxatilis TaxID=31220 RepID=A0AAN9AIT1_9CAEN